MLDDVDEMDTTEWNGQAVEDPTGSGSSTSTEAQQGTNSNSSQETAASSQQGQSRSQEGQPSGSSQTAGGQTQAQQNNAQQNNAQQNNAQQTPIPIKVESQDDSSTLFVPEEEVPGYRAPLLERPGSSTEGDKTTVGWTS